MYHIFQMVVTKVTADYDRWTLLKSNEPLITLLQARLRGRQCRNSFLSRMDYLKAHEQQAVTLQVQKCTHVCVCVYVHSCTYKITTPSGLYTLFRLMAIQYVHCTWKVSFSNTVYTCRYYRHVTYNRYL